MMITAVLPYVVCKKIKLFLHGCKKISVRVIT